MIWLLFIVFSSFLGGIACTKEVSEPEKYEIRVKNDYFEAILISVGDNFSENVSSKAVSSSFFLPKGKYLVGCITNSHLRIESLVSLQGTTEKLTIRLTSKGKIEVE